MKNYIGWFVVIVIVGVIGWVILSSKGIEDDPNNSKVSTSIEENGPTLGDPDAPVTIVEYGDFQCPICNRFFHEAEPQIKEVYIDTGKVKLVWKDFAFIGPDSQRAAEAAQCANAQGKFWEYHDVLYNHIWDNYYAKGINGENRGAFTKSNLKDFANQIELDTEQFNSCIDSGASKKAVNNGRTQGTAQGVRGTPTFFINGQTIVGSQPFSVFSQIIENKLP